MVARETCFPQIINGTNAFTTFIGLSKVISLKIFSRKGTPFDLLVILVTVPSEAVNMSLGLSMTNNPQSSNLVVRYRSNNSVLQLR